MKLDISKVHEVINSNPDLKYFYNWFLNHCTSLNLPYHNLRHTLGMMYHIICLYENSRKPGCKYGFSLEEKDLYILMISSLFHDYNHSGGRFTDDINVENAKNGLTACLNSYFEKSEMTDAVIEECKRTIDGTQYPYMISDEDLTLYQRILRECDITVCFYDDYITHRIFGLMEEMKTKDSIKMFLAKEAQFILESMKNLKLVYSIDLWNEHSKDYMTNLEILTQTIE